MSAGEIDLLKIFDAINAVGQQVAAIQVDLKHQTKNIQEHEERLDQVESRVSILERSHQEASNLLVQVNRNVTLIVEDVESLLTRDKRNAYIWGGAVKVIGWFIGTLVAVGVAFLTAYWTVKLG